MRPVAMNAPQSMIADTRVAIFAYVFFPFKAFVSLVRFGGLRSEDRPPYSALSNWWRKRTSFSK